jgi:hypothetical protein
MYVPLNSILLSLLPNQHNHFPREKVYAGKPSSEIKLLACKYELEALFVSNLTHRETAAIRLRLIGTWAHRGGVRLSPYHDTFRGNEANETVGFIGPFTSLTWTNPLEGISITRAGALHMAMRS